MCEYKYELANGKYKANEILLFYGEPIMYTVKDCDGNLYLGQLLDDDGTAMIVPINEKIVRDMKSHIITMKQAFISSDYAIYINENMEKKIDINSVSDDDLPDEGVFYL